MRAITEKDYQHLKQVLSGSAEMPTDPVSWLDSIVRPIRDMVAAGQITLEAFQ